MKSWLIIFSLSASVLAQGVDSGAVAEDKIHATVNGRFEQIVARYDATSNARLRITYQQIAAEALKVKPELQQSYMNQRNAEARSIAAELRSAYVGKVWAMLSETMERAIEQQRLEASSADPDQMQIARRRTSSSSAVLNTTPSIGVTNNITAEFNLQNHSRCS